MSSIQDQLYNPVIPIGYWSWAVNEEKWIRVCSSRISPFCTACALAMGYLKWYLSLVFLPKMTPLVRPLTRLMWLKIARWQFWFSKPEPEFMLPSRVHHQGTDVCLCLWSARPDHSQISYIVTFLLLCKEKPLARNSNLDSQKTKWDGWERLTTPTKYQVLLLSVRVLKTWTISIPDRSSFFWKACFFLNRLDLE